LFSSADLSPGFYQDDIEVRFLIFLISAASALFEMPNIS
jgi:hypothetical protein